MQICFTRGIFRDCAYILTLMNPVVVCMLCMLHIAKGSHEDTSLVYVGVPTVTTVLYV